MSNLKNISVGRLFTNREKFDLLSSELPTRAIVRRTFRDAFYLFIDSWREIKFAHKSYGDFQSYIKAKRVGKDLGEEQMDQLDLELMRKQLHMYHQTKSALTTFDLRWFYYMYVFWAIVLAQGGYQAWQRKKAYADMLGDDNDLSIEQRRQRFGRGYMEDVRT